MKVRRFMLHGEERVEYLPRGGFNSYSSALNHATDLRKKQPRNEYEVVTRNKAYPTFPKRKEG